MIDWQTAVTIQYGIEPTADAIEAACRAWDWRFAVDAPPGHATSIVCTITIPAPGGDPTPTRRPVGRWSRSRTTHPSPERCLG